MREIVRGGGGGVREREGNIEGVREIVRARATEGER